MRAWGDIAAIAAWSGLGLSLLGAAYLFFVVDDDARFARAFGDVPNVPEEARPARNRRGGSGESAGRAQREGQDIARHDKGAR